MPWGGRRAGWDAGPGAVGVLAPRRQRKRQRSGLPRSEVGLPGITWCPVFSAVFANMLTHPRLSWKTWHCLTPAAGSAAGLARKAPGALRGPGVAGWQCRNDASGSCEDVGTAGQGGDGSELTCGHPVTGPPRGQRSPLPPVRSWPSCPTGTAGTVPSPRQHRGRGRGWCTGTSSGARRGEVAVVLGCSRDLEKKQRKLLPQLVQGEEGLPSWAAGARLPSSSASLMRLYGMLITALTGCPHPTPSPVGWTLPPPALGGRLEPPRGAAVLGPDPWDAASPAGHGAGQQGGPAASLPAAGGKERAEMRRKFPKRFQGKNSLLRNKCLKGRAAPGPALTWAGGWEREAAVPILGSPKAGDGEHDAGGPARSVAGRGWERGTRAGGQQGGQCFNPPLSCRPQGVPAAAGPRVPG